jgi:hypothetical protein
MNEIDRGWIRALTQIACVMLTIRDVRSLGVTDEDIAATQRWNQARGIVEDWLR